MTLQIVASLIDAARCIIYNRHMFIVQATGLFVSYSIEKPNDMKVVMFRLIRWNTLFKNQGPYSQHFIFFVTYELAQ